MLKITRKQKLRAIIEKVKKAMKNDLFVYRSSKSETKQAYTNLLNGYKNSKISQSIKTYVENFNNINHDGKYVELSDEFAELLEKWMKARESLETKVRNLKEIYSPNTDIQETQRLALTGGGYETKTIIKNKTNYTDFISSNNDVTWQLSNGVRSLDAKKEHGQNSWMYDMMP